MDQHIRRVLSLQLALLLIVTVGAYAMWGAIAAKAAWFGVFIAITNTLLIAWRMRQNNNASGKPANLNEFIRSWLERYLLVGVLLALGLGGLKMLPLGLLSGFILGQLIWILAPLTIKET
jgi:ATP synthase protein I